MLREYELTLITAQQPSEADLRMLHDRYEAIFLADGGEIVRKDDWGVKKLAFPIKKHFRGHYMHYDFVGKPENLAEAERLMRIDEAVLRQLAVRIGENVNVEERRVELAKAAAAARRERDGGNRDDDMH